MTNPKNRPEMNNLYVYDVECYPNVFTAGLQCMSTGQRWEYECSKRGSNLDDFAAMMTWVNESGARWIGFNNEGYDYPLIHFIYVMQTQRGNVTPEEIYAKSKAIIESDRNDWSHNVWERDRVVQQIDLYKIMHFDNFARSTSLKKLEMAMRSESVVDLPYKPGLPLTVDQIPVLIDYMWWDIDQTGEFAKIVTPQIEFRDELTDRYGRNFTNFNDTKIGKQHFIDTIEQSGVQCYERLGGKRVPRQTPRNDGIKVADKLLWIPFATPSLQEMWQFFYTSVIPPKETKGFFKNLHASLGPFQMHFGAGGIHGSVNNQSFYSDDEYVVWDWDVTSYYPSLAIVNRWYPDHLGETFCDIYADLKKQRVGYAKGTPENAMLKLALNGVYGDSNNKYSPFYDPAYTMAITINGQLQLAWLAERLVTELPDLTMIQINTDGLTFRVPRAQADEVRQVCAEWSAATRLDLEDVEYRSMHVRDVNNYIAIDTNGKVKRKNAYLTDPDWHQDHSSLVVQKAVSEFVENGTRPVDFIYGHVDPYDFMRHIKVPKSSRLEHGDDVVQNTSRYYISLRGESLVKVMPPLAGETADRRIGVDVGWKTMMCNHINDFDWHNLNRRWYVQEADKLIEGLGLSVPY